MSLLLGQNDGFRKLRWLNAPAFRERLYRVSNELKATSRLTSLSGSRKRSESNSPTFSFATLQICARAMLSLHVAPKAMEQMMSPPGISSPRSTKRQAAAQPATHGRDDLPYHLNFDPSVAKTVAGMGVENPDFNPPLVELLLAIETNPTLFPKKSGALARTRAASLRYRGAAWRVVFAIDEKSGLCESSP
jgi:hypothetical protein